MGKWSERLGKHYIQRKSTISRTQFQHDTSAEFLCLDSLKSHLELRHYFQMSRAQNTTSWMLVCRTMTFLLYENKCPIPNYITPEAQFHRSEKKLGSFLIPLHLRKCTILVLQKIGERFFLYVPRKTGGTRFRYLV